METQPQSRNHKIMQPKQSRKIKQISTTERAKTALSQSVAAINDNCLVVNDYSFMPQSVANASNHQICLPESVNKSGAVDLNLSALGSDNSKKKVFIRSVRYHSKDCSQSSSDDTRQVNEESIDASTRPKLSSLITTPTTHRRPVI
jgi:hypothetical protein